VMDSGESAVNSELWVDANLVGAENNRQEILSSCLLRATDEVAVQALINNLSSDQNLEVDAIPEKEYFARQSTSSAPVQYAGILLAVIMSIGSAFAAMNTMYAAVARRSKEIGTLRILGFSQGEILLSFFTEALLLSLLGGVIGCILVLPLNNLNTGIGSFQTFNETSFRIKVTLPILLSGLGFSLCMGLIGGLFPARNAAKKEILVALKAT